MVIAQFDYTARGHTSQEEVEASGCRLPKGKASAGEYNPRMSLSWPLRILMRAESSGRCLSASLPLFRLVGKHHCQLARRHSNNTSALNQRQQQHRLKTPVGPAANGVRNGDLLVSRPSLLTARSDGKRAAVDRVEFTVQDRGRSHVGASEAHGQPM